jgi:hypothetical protein
MTIECHAGFTDPGATARDACAGAVPVTVLGSVNPNAVGSYTLTYNASDPSGNAAAPVARVVNVVDTTPPVISCPANITTISNDPGQCSAHVNVGAATATDNCSAPSIAGARSDGLSLTAEYPVGTTTITWTARDAAGNQSTCSQTVIVNPVPTFSLSVNPTTARRGSQVTLTSAFKNCASTSQAVVLEFTYTSPCTREVIRRMGPITLQAQQQGSMSSQFTIPSSACTGPYTLTLDWYMGGTKIGATTAQLTVVP